MSGTGPTQDQVELTQQMNNLLREQAALWEKVAQNMGNASQVSQQARDSLASNTEETERNVTQQQALNKALEENTGGANALGEAFGKTGEGSKSLTSGLDNVAETAGKAVTTFGLLKVAMNALNKTMALIGGGFTTVLDVFKGGFSIIQSGIGMAAGMISDMFAQAAQYRNEMNKQYFEANQSIVDTFGDLQSNQGAFVKSMKDELGPASQALAGANNSLYAAIGNGADILKEITALASDFGDSIVSLGDQLKGATSQLLLMKKGMGLTGDAMQNLASLSKSSGEPLEDSLNKTMQASAGLSKQFGVDVKIIGKGISALAGDMTTFGHLGPEALAATATYATKLGVAISDLKSVMDKFDSFEGAAEAAGKLNEAFGMNIDTMKMMNAENPAERIDMLRRSLQETGQSFEDLSRHEKKLMAQTMGMDMKSLTNAMSVDVDELGFGDFEDAAKDAVEQITPEQAMEKVSKSIRKLGHILTDLASGPLSNITAGFDHALSHSKEWKALMGDMGGFLEVFHQLGQELGHIFIKLMSTVGGPLMKSFRDLFNLKRITAFKKTVSDAFDVFFQAFSGKDKDGNPIDMATAAENLWTSLKEGFTEWLGGNKDNGTTIIDEMGKFFEKIVSGLVAILPKIVSSAADGINLFTAMLKGEGQEDSTSSKLFGVLKNAFVDLVNALYPVIKDEVAPALYDLFLYMWEVARPYVDKAFSYIGGIFGLQVIGGILGAFAAGAIVKKILGGISGFFGKIKAGLKSIFGMGGGETPEEQAQQQVENNKGFMEKIKDFTESAWGIDLKKLGYAGIVLTAVGLFVAGAFAAAVLEIKWAAGQLAGTKAEDLVKVGGVITVLVGAVLALSKAVKALDGVKVTKSGAMMMVGMLVLLGAVTYAIAEYMPGAMKSFAAGFGEGFPFERVNKGIESVAELLKVAGAIVVGGAILGAAVMTAASLIPGVGVGLLAAAIGAGILTLAGVVYALAQSAPIIGKSLKDLVQGLNINNPDHVLKTINIVGQIVEMIATLGGLAIRAEELKAANKTMGEGGAAQAGMAGMESFIVNSLGAMKTLVNGLVEAAKTMTDPQVQKGAEVITGIISAVAQLSGNLVGPLSKVKGDTNWWGKEQGNGEAMAKVANGISNILDKLGTSIPSLISGIITSISSLSKEQVQLLITSAPVLATIFDGIATMSETMERFMKTEIVEVDLTVFEKGFTQMNKVMTMDAFVGTIDAISVFSEKLGNVDHAAIATGVGSLREFRKSLVPLVNGLVKWKTDVFQDSNMDGIIGANVLMDLMAKPNSMYSPSVAITKIAEEAKNIERAMGQIEEIDIDTKLKPVMDGFMSSKGGKFTITPDGVRVTVNFNVSMDAEELATQIYKSNEKTKGFFEITDQAGQMELEGSRGILGSLFGT